MVRPAGLVSSKNYDAGISENSASPQDNLFKADNVQDSFSSFSLPSLPPFYLSLPFRVRGQQDESGGLLCMYARWHLTHPIRPPFTVVEGETLLGRGGWTRRSIPEPHGPETRRSPFRPLSTPTHPPLPSPIPPKSELTCVSAGPLRITNPRNPPASNLTATTAVATTLGAIYSHPSQL